MLQYSITLMILLMLKVRLIIDTGRITKLVLQLIHFHDTGVHKASRVKQRKILQGYELRTSLGEQMQLE